MNRHPNALMLSLIALLLAVMGLVQLQKLWKYILFVVIVAGVVLWWIFYFDILLLASRKMVH